MYEHRHRRSIPRLRGILRLGRGPRKGRGRGQALVEFALALPILIVLVAGVLEMGRGYSFAVATSDAARDAALEEMCRVTRTLRVLGTYARA